VLEVFLLVVGADFAEETIDFFDLDLEFEDNGQSDDKKSHSGHQKDHKCIERIRFYSVEEDVGGGMIGDCDHRLSKAFHFMVEFFGNYLVEGKCDELSYS
jgi:hypothetical protein